MGMPPAIAEPIARVKERVAPLLAWWKATRVGRALAWYGRQRGAQLCGGIAYSALFSLFGALTIGWTVFARLMGGNAELKDAVLDQLDNWVPGLVGEGDGYVVHPESLVLQPGVSWAAIIAGVVLLLAALGVMGALRNSVRTMFDLPDAGTNAIMAKVWQLAGFAMLGVGVLISAGSSVAIAAVGHQIESWAGGSQALGWGIRILTALVGVLIDALLVAGIIVLVGGVRPPRRDLIIGCLAAGVVAGGLRWLGTAVIVGSASRNALLAPFAAIVTILILVNFLARVLLTVCAWMHNPTAAEVESSPEG